jgi:transcriptional regulator with XRE-family HTH domain
MPTQASPRTPKSRSRRIDPLAGRRIREARLRAGLTQRQLAGDRYTASYVSALENGLTRPSMAALEYLAAQLGMATDYFIRDERPHWERMHADLLLASEEWTAAVDAYTSILDRALPEVERALVRRGRAEALCRLQRPLEALADASTAYPVLVAAKRQVDAAYAGYWLAYAHYQLDNIDEARSLIGQVLAEVRAGLSVQADFRLRLLVALANIEGIEGRHRQALAYLEEGRALTSELDDRRRATFLFSLALGYSEGGDHEAALRTGTEALALYQSSAAAYEVASLRNSLALTYLELGAIGRARTMAAQSLKDVERLGDDRLRAHVGETQARIALRAGEFEAALGRATETIHLARSIGYRRAEADGLITRARTHAAMGNPAGAEVDFDAAATLLRLHGPRSRLREVLRDWSAVLVGQDRHPEAVTLLTEAVSD